MGRRGEERQSEGRRENTGLRQPRRWQERVEADAPAGSTVTCMRKPQAASLSLSLSEAPGHLVLKPGV